MKPEELVERLNLYKKELPKRGMVLGLMVMLPGVILIIAIAVVIDVFNPPLWKLIVMSSALMLFIIGVLFWFVYMAHVSLPSKMGLNCPGCDNFIMNGDPKKLLETGVCEKCGAVIIEYAGKPSYTGQDIEAKEVQVKATDNTLKGEENENTADRS